MAPSLDTERDAVVLDYTFGASSLNALEIGLSGAVVELRATPGQNQVRVHGFVPDCDPNRARETFDSRDISTHHDADRLHIYGADSPSTADEWRWLRSHGERAHIHVNVPPDLKVQAHLPGGELTASGLSGPVTARVPGGAMRGTDIDGPLTVRGGGDSVVLTDCSCPTLDLQWATGRIELEHIEVDTLDLRSMAAATSVRDLSGSSTLTVHAAPLTLEALRGPCEAHVDGGTLTYEGTPQHDLDLTTVGDTLTARLPSTANGELELSGMAMSLDDAFTFDGEHKPDEIVGRLGNGGPEIRLRAIRGEAHCHAR